MAGKEDIGASQQEKVSWATTDRVVQGFYGNADAASTRWQAFAKYTELHYARFVLEEARGPQAETAQKQCETALKAVDDALVDTEFAREYQHVMQTAQRIERGLVNSLRPRLMMFPDAEQMAERKTVKTMKFVKDRIEEQRKASGPQGK